MRAFAAVVALLAFAVPAAQAKAPPLGVKICGATACRSVSQEDAERMGIWHLASSVTPGKPAPFYVVRYRWNAKDPEQTSYWIPSTGLLRVVTPNLISWYRFGRGALEPFVTDPAAITMPRITAVTVRGRAVRGPASYVRLFTEGRRVDVWPEYSWLRVRFTSTAPSPWTDASADVRISSGGAFLLRDDIVFAIPKRMADRVRRGLALSP